MRFTAIAVLLSVPVICSAQVPWVVSIDLGNPNLEYGISQKLTEAPGGWTRVVTLGGETVRGILPKNPSERPVEGIFLDVNPEFSQAAHGKTLWVLVEVFSPKPESLAVYYSRLGNRPEDEVSLAAPTLTTLPTEVRATPNHWGFLLFRCENASLENRLKGGADLRLELPDERTVVNRVLVTRTGPEFTVPDTGGVEIGFSPQLAKGIQGPALSPLPPPGPIATAYGKVEDPDGVGGVGGVLVELLPLTGTTTLYKTYSDSSGEFRFPLVEAGTYRLRTGLGGENTRIRKEFVIVRSKRNNDIGSAHVLVYGAPFTSRFQSRLDETWQPYALFLPKEYPLNENRLFPLVVALHGEGKGPLHCLRYLVEAGPVPFILLGPGGRGDSNYEGIGEADVLEVIDQVRKHYRIDPDRIHLTGYGMGGTGSLKIATRYPDRFASVSALAAIVDFLSLPGNREIPFFQKMNLRAFSPRYHLENVRELPVRLYQPKDDPLFVAQGEIFQKEMQRRNQFFLYREIPASGEELMRAVYGDRSFFELLSGDRRRSLPHEVVLQADTLTPGESYWVRLVHRQREDRPARIDARVLDSGTIWIETGNVARMQVGLNHSGLFSQEELKIWWNGNLSWTGVPADRKTADLRMTRTGGRWVKKPYLSGPPSAVFLSPFLYVMGENIRWTPRENAYRDWIESQGWTGHTPRLVSAQEISSQDLKTRNLVLFGLPSENTLVQTVVGDLPLKVGKNRVSIGKHTFQGKDIGFATVFPNPLAEDKLILWVAGFSPEGIRNLMRTGFRWPDYLIVDDRSARSGEADDVLGGGFYDRLWRFREAFFYKSPRVHETTAQIREKGSGAG